MTVRRSIVVAACAAAAGLSTLMGGPAHAATPAGLTPGPDAETQAAAGSLYAAAAATHRLAGSGFRSWERHGVMHADGTLEVLARTDAEMADFGQTTWRRNSDGGITRTWGADGWTLTDSAPMAGWARLVPVYALDRTIMDRLPGRVKYQVGPVPGAAAPNVAFTPSDMLTDLENQSLVPWGLDPHLHVCVEATPEWSDWTCSGHTEVGPDGLRNWTFTLAPSTEALSHVFRFAADEYGLLTESSDVTEWGDGQKDKKVTGADRIPNSNSGHQNPATSRNSINADEFAALVAQAAVQRMARNTRRAVDRVLADWNLPLTSRNAKKAIGWLERNQGEWFWKGTSSQWLTVAGVDWVEPALGVVSFDARSSTGLGQHERVASLQVVRGQWETTYTDQ